MTGIPAVSTTNKIIKAKATRRCIDHSFNGTVILKGQYNLKYKFPNLQKYNTTQPLPSLLFTGTCPARENSVLIIFKDGLAVVLAKAYNLLMPFL